MLKFIDNYLLKNITTLSIGGPAKKFAAVKTQEELVQAIQYAKENNLDYLIIGGGSNLLIADEGVNALVIKNEIVGISASGESKPTPEVPVKVKVKSGTPLQALVDYAISHQLAGLQKLAGIPGTVGGAIYGNAGAYGQAISDHLITVTTLNPNNLTIQQFNNPECRFGYRDSIFKKTHHFILEVEFQLTAGDTIELKKEAEQTLAARLIKYPKGIKCPGSFFKNLIASDLPAEILARIPAGKIVYGKIPAGTLLEIVGAKDQSVDGIEIAPYHANLFLNTGTGTAKAFYTLAKEYAKKVKEKFGVILEPEVQLINLPPLL
ncbi:UDP-N-acetylmuramate dehydrogenase [Candidatus Daviesbacteria bacterium]|nr:UDP-N-acetylmuramate dehydrogenase [Candidatus Daviesbacteria bacterium]